MLREAESLPNNFTTFKVAPQFIFTGKIVRVPFPACSRWLSHGRSSH
jgi:hypothetical protein